MKPERFNYLNETHLIDEIFFDIMKIKMFPALNLSYREFAQKHNMAKRRPRKPVTLWEVCLNILMREYGFSKEFLEEAVKKGVKDYKEDFNRKYHELMTQYNKPKNKD